MSEQKSSVSIRFHRSAQCVTTPASGVWWSPTPDGALSLRFYVERQAVPDQVVAEIQGNVQRIVRQEGGATVENPALDREFVAEVILSPAATIQVSQALQAAIPALGITPEIVQKVTEMTVPLVPKADE
jgi:hypothetical protein